MMKVVVADDERRVCQLLMMLVDWPAFGFEIVGMAHNGNELLEKIIEVRPDLIVMDVKMPGLTGIEVLHKIRELGIEARVIIMSGYREFDYIHAALKDGALDYWLKPLNQKTMEATLKTIQENIEREEEIKKRETTPSFRRDFLNDILANRIKVLDYDEIKNKYTIDWRNTQLCIVAVKVDLMMDEDYAETNIQECIDNILLKDINSWEIPGFWGENQNISYLLFGYDSEEAVKKKLYHLIQMLREYFVKLHHGNVSIGVSILQGNAVADAVRESYCAALDQMYRGNNKVLFYRLLEKSSAAEMFTRENEEGIRKGLRVGEYGQIVPIFNKILSKILSEGRNLQSGAFVYEEMIKLENRLADIVHPMYFDERLDSHIQTYTNELSNCGDERAYLRVWSNELQILIDEIENLQKQKKSQPVRLLQRAIEEKYREDLTLASLAEAVEMNPEYVSRLFKKEMHTTITKYLNTVRINNAKEQLRHSRNSISEIAVNVGYNDEKYFMRVFKKEVGLTVSEYRKLYGE